MEVKSKAASGGEDAEVSQFTSLNTGNPQVPIVLYENSDTEELTSRFSPNRAVV